MYTGFEVFIRYFHKTVFFPKFIHVLIVDFIEFINNLYMRVFFNASKNFGKKTCFKGCFSFSLFLAFILNCPSFSSSLCLLPGLSNKKKMF